MVHVIWGFRVLGRWDLASIPIKSIRIVITAAMPVSNLFTQSPLTLQVFHAFYTAEIHARASKLRILWGVEEKGATIGLKF